MKNKSHQLQIIIFISLFLSSSINALQTTKLSISDIFNDNASSSRFLSRQIRPDTNINFSPAIQTGGSLSIGGDVCNGDPMKFLANFVHTSGNRLMNQMKQSKTMLLSSLKDPKAYLAMLTIGYLSPLVEKTLGKLTKKFQADFNLNIASCRQMYEIGRGYATGDTNTEGIEFFSYSANVPGFEKGSAGLEKQSYSKAKVVCPNSKILDSGLNASGNGLKQGKDALSNKPGSTKEHEKFNSELKRCLSLYVRKSNVSAVKKRLGMPTPKSKTPNFDGENINNLAPQQKRNAFLAQMYLSALGLAQIDNKPSANEYAPDQWALIEFADISDEIVYDTQNSTSSLNKYTLEKIGVENPLYLDFNAASSISSIYDILTNDFTIMLERIQGSRTDKDIISSVNIFYKKYKNIMMFSTSNNNIVTFLKKIKQQYGASEASSEILDGTGIKKIIGTLVLIDIANGYDFSLIRGAMNTRYLSTKISSTLKKTISGASKIKGYKDLMVIATKGAGISNTGLSELKENIFNLFKNNFNKNSKQIFNNKRLAFRVDYAMNNDINLASDFTHSCILPVKYGISGTSLGGRNDYVTEFNTLFNGSSKSDYNGLWKSLKNSGKIASASSSFSSLSTKDFTSSFATPVYRAMYSSSAISIFDMSKKPFKYFLPLYQSPKCLAQAALIINGIDIKTMGSSFGFTKKQLNEILSGQEVFSKNISRYKNISLPIWNKLYSKSETGVRGLNFYMLKPFSKNNKTIQRYLNRIVTNETVGEFTIRALSKMRGTIMRPTPSKKQLNKSAPAPQSIINTTKDENVTQTEDK